MKNIFVVTMSVLVWVVFTACGGGEKKLDEKEQKAVEQQVQKDQQAMDSLEKAIKAQIDAVNDDSLMKAEH
jgi:cell division protein FtsB